MAVSGGGGLGTVEKAERFWWDSQERLIMVRLGTRAQLRQAEELGRDGDSAHLGSVSPGLTVVYGYGHRSPTMGVEKIRSFCRSILQSANLIFGFSSGKREVSGDSAEVAGMVIPGLGLGLSPGLAERSGIRSWILVVWDC